MSDEPTPTPESEPTKTEPSVTQAPQWAIDLKAAIEELPGKLRATVTDDDRRSLAEAVYDLFDSGGAFKDPTEPPKQEPDVTPKQEPEPTPKKHGRLAGFAEWFAGEQ